MKKAMLLLGLFMAMTMVSCKKDVTPPPAPPVPVDTPAPPDNIPPPAPEADPAEEADGTSVSIGKDGINVDTKSDTKKTKVTVNGSGTAVEVKK